MGVREKETQTKQQPKRWGGGGAGWWREKAEAEGRVFFFFFWGGGVCVGRVKPWGVVGRQTGLDTGVSWWVEVRVCGGLPKKALGGLEGGRSSRVESQIINS